MSAKTVANHVSHVLTKLQARDRVEAVLRARGPDADSCVSAPGRVPASSRAGGRGVGVQLRGDGVVEGVLGGSGGTPSASAICSQLAPPRSAARMPISWLSCALRETTSPRASSSSAS